LERVLALAEPQGYMRLFLDEGAPMARLLAQLQASRPTVQSYVQALRAACHAQEQLRVAGPAVLSKEASPGPQHALVDPLSEREVEVLRLLALGASNAEIAERLVVATSTVKYHVKNILAKLAVANRTQAAARAHELGLL
jgi:LuxR family maltose regulon positive regulatory protein